MTSLPAWLLPHANAQLGTLIDHTLLRPEATESEILSLCDEAIALGLGTVCVNGQWVGVASKRLAGSGIRVAGVVGFPLGASGRASKAAEANALVEEGATELDVVLSLGLARAGRWDLVQEELEVVVAAARGAAVKVILETAALEPAMIPSACAAARAAGAAFVKTSTGMHAAGGATEAAVVAMRNAVGLDLGVKASGGVRTAEAALRMLRAGADRIGTSAAGQWTTCFGATGPSVAQLLESGLP